MQLGNAGSRADGETFGDGGVPGLTEEGDESTGTEEGATLAARCRGKDSTVIRKMAAVAAAEGDHGTAFGLGTIAWKRINEIPAGSGRDELERQLRADLEEWGRLANSGTSGDRRKTLVDSP